MKTTGSIITAIGFLAMVYAFFGFDPTVPGDAATFSRTVNLQLLQVQTMIFHFGLAADVVGAIYIAAGAILERMSGPLMEQPAVAPGGSYTTFNPADHVG